MSGTSNIPSKTEHFDSILGTPSSQNILRLLFCWGQLPVKKLVKKSNLSESQVYNTIRSLESVGLVESVSRGIYSYTKNDFSLKLKEAYISQLIQIIGQQLHEISTNIDIIDIKSLDNKFSTLVTLWEPILDGYYALKVSSIAGHILERFK